MVDENVARKRLLETECLESEVNGRNKSVVEAVQKQKYMMEPHSWGQSENNKLKRCGHTWCKLGIERCYDQSSHPDDHDWIYRADNNLPV